MNQWYFPHPPASGKVMESDAEDTMQTFAAYQTYGGSPAGSTPYFGPHDKVLEFSAGLAQSRGRKFWEASVAVKADYFG